MARVLVAIDDPFDREKEPPERRLPLLLDSWVEVHIEGNRSEELVRVPRRALRDGKFLYINQADSLLIRTPTIAWRDETSIFVKDGVETGEHIIVSPISMATPGLKLRDSNRPPLSGDEDGS